MLAENLARVQQRIRQSCERAGRDPASVTLVVVTKGVPLQTIQEAVALGLTDVGENRVQEAGAKIAALSDARVRWHLIGHLQRNKAKAAVELFDVIHSVDSLALAGELERHAAQKVRSSEFARPGKRSRRAGGVRHYPLDIFIQVNVSGESTKFGCRPDEAVTLARHIAGCLHLRLTGFMTMAPFGDDPEQARPCFHQLRLLRDSLNSEFRTPNSQLLLSMGMSQDFEVAIEEGADLVRIGTAIFR